MVGRRNSGLPRKSHGTSSPVAYARIPKGSATRPSIPLENRTAQDRATTGHGGAASILPLLKLEALQQASPVRPPREPLKPVLKVHRNAYRRAFHLFREKMYFHAFRSRAPVIRPCYSRSGYKILRWKTQLPREERNRFLITFFSSLLFFSFETLRAGNQDATPSRSRIFHSDRCFVERIGKGDLHIITVDMIARFRKSVTGLMFQRIRLTCIHIV